MMDTIEHKIRKLGWADNYLKFIELKKKGLRKPAQEFLKLFFEDFRMQELKNRREFIDLINTFTFESNDYNTYLPTNMHRNLFLPEIESWELDEPYNPSPYKWSNDWNKLKKALELDSRDQVILEKCGNYLISKISMNQHEISKGFPYDGNPDEDVSNIELFEKFLCHFKNEQKKVIFFKALSDLKQTAISYRAS